MRGEPTAFPATEPSTMAVPAATRRVAVPAAKPSARPTTIPAAKPSANCTTIPATEPTACPTAVAADEAGTHPATIPTAEPRVHPAAIPATEPGVCPTAVPAAKSSTHPAIVFASHYPCSLPGLLVHWGGCNPQWQCYWVDPCLVPLRLLPVELRYWAAGGWMAALSQSPQLIETVALLCLPPKPSSYKPLGSLGN